jgi:hypothetical protein
MTEEQRKQHVNTVNTVVDDPSHVDLYRGDTCGDTRHKQYEHIFKVANIYL